MPACQNGLRSMPCKGLGRMRRSDLCGRELQCEIACRGTWPPHLMQSSFVSFGQCSRMTGPPAERNFSTVATAFAVGFCMSSSSSSPLSGHRNTSAEALHNAQACSVQYSAYRTQTSATSLGIPLPLHQQGWLSYQEHGLPDAAVCVKLSRWRHAAAHFSVCCLSLMDFLPRMSSMRLVPEGGIGGRLGLGSPYGGGPPGRLCCLLCSGGAAGYGGANGSRPTPGAGGRGAPLAPAKAGWGCALTGGGGSDIGAGGGGGMADTPASLRTGHRHVMQLLRHRYSAAEQTSDCCAPDPLDEPRYDDTEGSLSSASLDPQPVCTLVPLYPCT